MLSLRAGQACWMVSAGAHVGVLLFGHWLPLPALTAASVNAGLVDHGSAVVTAAGAVFEQTVDLMPAAPRTAPRAAAAAMVASVAPVARLPAHQMANGSAQADVPAPKTAGGSARADVPARQTANGSAQADVPARQTAGGSARADAPADVPAPTTTAAVTPAVNTARATSSLLTDIVPTAAPDSAAPVPGLDRPAVGAASHGATMAAVAGKASIGTPGNNLSAEPALGVRYLASPMPAYPLAARRLGEEGVVLVRVQVDVDGQPGALRVVEGSGFVELDHAALAALRTWRFLPAQRGGERLPGVIDVPVRFRLNAGLAAR